MDNVSKALEIAGGVLIAVLIMSLVSYVFSKIGLWPQEEEIQLDTEQLAKFNLEYEVFDKKAMYGVDVISCLNKALSNNEKYAEGGGFLSGSRYGDEYYINVFVQIKDKPLSETLSYYYFTTTGSLKQGFEDEIDIDPGYTNGITLGDLKDLGGSSSFDLSGGEASYTLFNNSSLVASITNELSDNTKFLVPTDDDSTNIPSIDEIHTFDEEDYFGNTGEKYYSLITFDSSGNRNDDNQTKLQNLVKLTSKTDGSNYVKKVNNLSSKNLDKWGYVEWKTALYDLKTRKFRCTYIKYNEKTGRVCEIYFQEI